MISTLPFQARLETRSYGIYVARPLYIRSTKSMVFFFDRFETREYTVREELVVLKRISYRHFMLSLASRLNLIPTSGTQNQVE